MNSEVILRDEPFNLFNSFQKLNYFHVDGNGHYMLAPFDKEDQVIINSKISFSRFFYHSARDVYGISQFMKDVGGFASAFLIIGSVCVGFFAQKMMYNSLIKKVYQVEKGQYDKQDKQNHMHLGCWDKFKSCLRGHKNQIT
jgi:hypothetical protein